MLFPFYMNSHGTLPIEKERSSFRASLLRVRNASISAALVHKAREHCPYGRRYSSGEQNFSVQQS
jgi:hypothetical protein